MGLVLGAGGVAGGAFHAGVLAALAEVTGWDPRRAEVVVGTSAGAIAAASLRAGLPAADMLARAEGRPFSPEGQRVLARAGPPGRPPPLRPGGGRVLTAGEVAATLARAASRPLSARPLALLAGLLPEGTAETALITQGVGAIAGDAWPEQPLWLCAVRQRDGRLVVFGRDVRPPVPLAAAASCAIPGFFRPVEIDGEAYVDGGVHSPTNADTLVGAGVDLVVVSSPMSIAGRGLRLAVDQPVRRWARALLDAEAVRLRRRGATTVAFQPTAEDAAVMGVNAMDPSRRAAIARQAYESTRRRLARHDARERLARLGPATG